MRRPLVVIVAAVLSGILIGLPGIPIVYRLVPILYLIGMGLVLVNKCRGKNKMPLYFFTFVSVFSLLFGFYRADSETRKFEQYNDFYEKYEASNPGEFNYALYLKSINICNEEERASIKTRNRAIERPMERVLWDIKEDCAMILNTYFSETDAGIIKAMLLGDKSSMDDELKSLYQESGIAHLLAVSGLHVSMVGTAAVFLAQRIPGFGKKETSVTGCILVTIYAIFTGASGSSLRAAIMFSIGMLSVFLGRKKDLASSLCFAAVCLLVYQPYLIMQSGFLLSFGAIAGIIYASWFSKRWNSGKTLASCIGVTLFTMPVVAYSYFKVPLYSFILNIAVIPLMTLVFISGACTLLSGGLVKAIIISLSDAFISRFTMIKLIPVIFSLPAHYILKIYSLLSEWSLKLPGARILTGRPGAIQIVIYYLFLLLCGAVIRSVRDNRYIPAVLFGSYLLSFPILKYRETVSCYVTVLDVGQGDCFHIHCDDTDVIIDCGSTGYERAGSRILENYLLSRRIDTLDTVIVSHADSDHTNGILYLYSEESEIKPGKMCLPALAKEDEKYEKLKKASGGNFHLCSKGDVIKKDGMELRCVYSETEKDAIKDTNRESTVWLYHARGFTMLFTGDITKEEEKKIIKNSTFKNESINVIKCAHHGSETANSMEFLKETDPDYAVLSYGKNNRYGHPSEEVTKRLEELDIGILTTEKMGAITFRIKEKTYEIQRFLPGS